MIALAFALLVQSPIELVESWPVETTLDQPDLRDADVVWTEMIERAQRSIDFAEFYASSEKGSKLESVLAAVEAAATRGVRVRFLLDRKMSATYPDTLKALDAHENVDVATIDYKSVAGGVLHAKYFVVDGKSAFVGSQNLDWRALEHIQELGLRIDVPEVAAAMQETFERDFATAQGRSREAVAVSTTFPLAIGAGAERSSITPVFSPKDFVPREDLWDLPELVALIDGARSSVRLQLLTYKPLSRGGEYFADLENALRRAAARGAKVELLFADWCKRKGTIEALQSLEPLANVEVKLVTIPQASSGFVPYARVVHAKYLVVDGKNAWLGTSNWERDYFFQSRNVGLVLEGGPIPARLDAFFTSNWASKYAYAVDPCAQYEAPRIGD